MTWPAQSLSKTLRPTRVGLEPYTRHYSPPSIHLPFVFLTTLKTNRLTRNLIRLVFPFEVACLIAIRFSTVARTRDALAIGDASRLSILLYFASNVGRGSFKPRINNVRRKRECPLGPLRYARIRAWGKRRGEVDEGPSQDVGTCREHVRLPNTTSTSWKDC